MAPRLAGMSTVAVFTAIGVTLMLAAFAFNAPVRSELLPFLVLWLLPVIIPPAVVPAGMRLAGRRLPPRPFARTIGVVIAMQLAMTGLIVPLTFQERARRFSRHREEPASHSLSVSTGPQLVASIARGVRGSSIAWNELGRRAALATTPALLGIIGWQLGMLFGFNWPKAIADWCALGFFVVATSTPPARVPWWVQILWLALLAIGLTAAARLSSHPEANNGH
jgi:hypothetical protein